MIVKLIIKVAFIFLLLLGSFNLYTDPEHWTFISGVNLIFHEAGHVIFASFGNFIHALGGALGQLLIPFAIMFYFLRRGNYFAFAFSLWWLSTALFDVGIYAADAMERTLPLITGDPGTHDWWYLLSKSGLIGYDNLVGGLFVVLSAATLLFAVAVFYKDIKKTIGILLKRYKKV